MSDTRRFLDEMMPRIHEAETALHNGDAGARRPGRRNRTQAAGLREETDKIMRIGGLPRSVVRLVSGTLLTTDLASTYWSRNCFVSLIGSPR